MAFCIKNRTNLSDNESKIIARLLPTTFTIATSSQPLDIIITEDASQKIIKYSLCKQSPSDSWYNFRVMTRQIQRYTSFLCGANLPLALLYFDKSNNGPHFVTDGDPRDFPLFDSENNIHKDVSLLPDKLNTLLKETGSNYFIKRAISLSGEAILQWFEDPEAILLNAWKSIEILVKYEYLKNNKNKLPTSRILEETEKMLESINIKFDKSKLKRYYELRGYAAHGIPQDYDTTKEFEAKDTEYLKEISNDTCFEVTKLSRLALKNVLEKELNFSWT